MLRVAVVGVGAMGCLFAGYLSPFAEVTMVGHWQPQLDALQRGLTIMTPEGRMVERRVAVTSAPHRLKPVSIALVLVKSSQTARSAAEIQALLEPDGMAITLQNGAGNEQTLAAVLGARRVTAGTTTEGATLIDVGVVRHAGRGLTVLPLLSDKRAAHLDAFAGVIRQAGFDVEVSAQAEARIWEKLAVNAAINPLTALLDAPNGLLVENEAAKRIARMAAKEAALVARAQGHDVDPQSAADRAIAVATATRQNISSMLQDVRNGRVTELEAITGSVVRIGREWGIDIKVNAALYHLLTIKLGGGSWTTAIVSLPPELQPLFLEVRMDG